MRKIFLSAIVLISFLSYAISLRTKAATQVPAIIPQTYQTTSIPLNPTAVPPIPSPTARPLTTNSPRITPTQQPIPTSTPKPTSQYKDGTYVGSVADAFYGNIQVQITISGGRISSVQFLQYPNDRDTSISINQQADPILAQEAIQAQSANVDIVSGATDTSRAFIESMQSALAQAKS